MVTKERMNIFINEHVKNEDKVELTNKVFCLMSKEEEKFIDELESLLTIEDIIYENAESILIEIVGKYTC